MSIPYKILQKLKLNGAKVQLIESGLYSITNITVGDKAWNIYKEWINEKYKKQDDYIKIGAGFFPTFEIKNSDKCPSLNLVYQIQTEANSLIYYIDNYIDNVILDPIDGCKIIEKIQQSKVIELSEIIQNPPFNYSTLWNLKSKSYICTLNHQWDNAGLLINIFKD